jgi:acylphosphatase
LDSRPIHPSPETRLVRVRGLVQGVGYRYACLQHAHALGVTGWVRNRTDGSVEAMLQGAPQQLDQMCDRMVHQVPTARVEAVEITQVTTPAPVFESFEQRPTA